MQPGAGSRRSGATDTYGSDADGSEVPDFAEAEEDGFDFQGGEDGDGSFVTNAKEVVALEPCHILYADKLVFIAENPVSQSDSGSRFHPTHARSRSGNNLRGSDVSYSR
jgi:hypothetical protein